MAADIGHTLSCEVTATNSAGQRIQESEPVVAPEGTGSGKPVDKERPAVSSNEPVRGKEVTCKPGTWSGQRTPKFEYRWLREEEGEKRPILTGLTYATGPTYKVAEADQGHSLACRVIAINSEGVTTAESPNSQRVPGTPPNFSKAAAVSGNGVVGEVLKCTGTASGEPTPKLTYLWLREEGAKVAIATGSTYAVESADEGDSLYCKVTATNSVDSTESESAGLYVQGSEPVDVEAPRVSGTGTPSVGSEMTCVPGTWTGKPKATLEYQWLLDGGVIASATTQTYTVTSTDQGRSLSCEVIATNREGKASAVSNGIHVPGHKPEAVEPPQISGSPLVGQSLTCLRGIWAGKPPPTFTYQWLRDGASIPAATGSTYAVQPGDPGHLLTCVVTAVNTEGNSEAESNGVAVPYGTIVLTPETRPTVPIEVGPTATAAQILTALGTQLPRDDRGARIASMLKSGGYSFLFGAPAAGTLQVFWYEVPSGAHVSAARKPVLVAASTTTFASPSRKTVKLRLTSAGRQLLKHSKRVKLTVKAVFTSRAGVSATWLKTLVLSR